MGWYRAGVKLTWGFTKESLQDATHTPKTSLICGSRPPNIVDLPEFKGRLTTSTRYHDGRGGGKRISRRKKHLREPRRTTRRGGNTPPGPRGAEAYGHPGTPDRRPLGAWPNCRPCAECSPPKFIGGLSWTVMGSGQRKSPAPPRASLRYTLTPPHSKATRAESRASSA